MATQELAGFLAAIIFASKTGLIDKFINAKNGDGGLIGPPVPPPKDTEDKFQYPPEGVCYSKAQYVHRWGPVTEKEYREYINLSGCTRVTLA